MNERDKWFILCDLIEWINTEGLRSFMKDLKREFPNIYTSIVNYNDVDQKISVLLRDVNSD